MTNSKLQSETPFVSLQVLSLMILFLCAGDTNVIAQRSATDSSTPLALAPGAPAGSYALSGLETVNEYNGSLNFKLPLLRIGGRGSVGYTLSLPIETHWRTLHKSNDNQTMELPVLDWWNLRRRRYGAGQMEGRLGSDSSCTPNHTSVFLSRLTFTAPDGTEYELHDQLTGGQPQSYFCGAGTPYPSRGTVFVTADGTAATFISDTIIRDDGSVATPSGYLSLRDGTRYRISRGDVIWMRDRNGNQLSFAYAPPFEMTVTDSLNREVDIKYADLSSRFYDEITYGGFGGAVRTIRVNYTPLRNALRTDRPGDAASVQTFAALFPQLTGAPTSNDAYVACSVVLPDSTQQYKFLYNAYAELARVTLPTGGTFEYDFANGALGDDTTGVVWTGSALPEIYRRLLRRRVYSDQGSSLESLTTYSRPEVDTPGYVEVNHYTSDQSTLIARERHFFFGLASASFNQGPLDYASWRDGKEYQTDYFSANGQALLKRVTQKWEQRSLFWWNRSADEAPPNNPYISETTTLLADTGQVSTTTHVNPQSGQAMIDQFNNFLDTWVYDYDIGRPGALLTHTHVDYLAVNNGVDYTARTSLASPHLLSLPTRQSVYDAAEIERNRITYEYDNYTADSFHAALKDWPSLTGVPITGLDSNYSQAFLLRGNATGSSRYLLLNGQPAAVISEYSQFDIAGNVVSSIDARSTSANVISSTISYDDCFGAPDAEARANTVPDRLASPLRRTYAFPTIASNALGQKTYTQYDYYLGRPVDVEDANGSTYTGYYSDPFERPSKMIKASNRASSLQSLTTFIYDDSNHTITTNTDLRTYGDQVLKEQTIYDGLGRTTETRQYEGGTNYIAARRTYDALGRTSQSSNPFRPWKAETPVWNTVTFDGLSRMVSSTTADAATTTTTYTGSEVTTTEQQGKKRKATNDALGRLTAVAEDPAGLNLLTTYTYDALGNLTVVSQGNQLRTFQYDSLSRMTAASLPETGSSSYSYDNNGNLLSRVDARGVITNLVYDSLNRVITKTYQNDAAFTPAVNYFYDSQGLPAGAPAAFARGFSIGRLVAVTYGANNGNGDYSSYDAVGRTTGKVQRLGGGSFQTTAAYNASGQPANLTYPSGHIVYYNYDAAGRLADRDGQLLAMTGTLGDGTLRTYASAVTYSNRNTLAQEKFGTDTPIYDKLFYNARGQLAEIRESTSPNNTTWNRGAIINHYSNTCWGMCSGQNMPDNNGDLKKQDHWIPDNEAASTYQTYSQTFHYDSLSRLQDMSETRYVNDANPILSFTQAYAYDRYGNRSINATGTTANAGINSALAAVAPNTTTNRMYGPGESEQNHPLFNYDAAGNQTKDYYSGNGTRFDRTFDAEGRLITSKATDSFGTQTSTYTYDGNGARVRRSANGSETWMVYGIGGELLAEYAANATPTAPQKEFGYRNGQLLISAVISSSNASATQNLVAYWKFDEGTGTSTADSSGNGRQGTLVNGAGWSAGQSAAAVNFDGINDYVQIGSQSALHITTAGTIAAWVYPTGSGSHAIYGGTIAGKEGEYLLNRAANGHLNWAFSNADPGWAWHDTGGMLPLNQWTHVAVTYDAGIIRSYVNGNLIDIYNGSGSISDYDNGAHDDFRIGGREDSVQYFQGRIDELRVYNRILNPAEVGAFVNTTVGGAAGYWKFDENTGTTTVDSSGNGHPGTLANGATWTNGQVAAAATFDGVNDYVQIGSQASLSISTAGALAAWIYPTGTGSNPTYGGTIAGKEGEYLLNRGGNGHLFWAFSNSDPGWAWHDTGASLPLNQWTHVTVTYAAGVIRSYVNGTLVDTYNGAGSIVDYDNGSYNDFRIGGRQESVQHFQGKIDEVRVYTRTLSPSEVAALLNDSGPSPATSGVDIRWIIADQLGTPRMIFDKSGSLASTRRHDYLAFGEELMVGVGQRSAAQGYGAIDGLRQKFTGKERDDESGLDYFLARHYGSINGRFVSPDPLLASGRAANPQSWNRYAYVLNNPMRFVDPSGLSEENPPQTGESPQMPAPPVVDFTETRLVYQVPGWDTTDEGNVVPARVPATVNLSGKAAKELDAVYKNSYAKSYMPAQEKAAMERLGTTEKTAQTATTGMSNEFNGSVTAGVIPSATVGEKDTVSGTRSVTSTTIPQLQQKIDTLMAISSFNDGAIDRVAGMTVSVPINGSRVTTSLGTETATTLVKMAAQMGKDAAQRRASNSMSTAP